MASIGGGGTHSYGLPTWQAPSGQGSTSPGGGAPGGAPGPGGATSDLNTPPAPQYTPGPQYQPQTYNDPNLGTMAQHGKDFLDPNSPYFQQLMEGMRQQIGQQSGAAQRAQSLRNVWSGGSGGGELMESAGDIGRAGLNAAGNASADLRMRAPQMGAQMLQSTFNPTQQQFSRTQQDRQYGHGSAQQDAQFGAGLASNQWETGGNWAMQQQANAANDARFQAEMQMQQYLAELNSGIGGFS